MAFTFTAGQKPGQLTSFQSFALSSPQAPVASLPSSSLWGLDGDDDAPPLPLLAPSLSFAPPPPLLSATSVAPVAAVSLDLDGDDGPPPLPPLSLASSLSIAPRPPVAAASRPFSPSDLPPDLPPPPSLYETYPEDIAFYSHLPYYFDHCLEVVDLKKGKTRNIDDFLLEMRRITYADIQDTQIQNRYDPHFIGRIIKGPIPKYVRTVDFSPYVIEQNRVIHRRLIMNERVQFFEHVYNERRMNRLYKMDLMYYMLWVMKQLFRLYDHVNDSGEKLFDENSLSPDFLEDSEEKFVKRESLLRMYLAHEKSEKDKAIDKVILVRLMQTWGDRVINEYFRGKTENDISYSMRWCIAIETILLWLCTTTPEGIQMTKVIRAQNQMEGEVVGGNKNLGDIGKGGADVYNNILSFLGKTRKKQSTSTRRMKKNKSCRVRRSTGKKI